jgi:thiamine biosynthesis lipoprotein
MSFVEYKRGCEAMATLFEVRLRGEDEEHLEAVAVAVLEEIVRLDAVFSRYDLRSEVSRINRHAGRAAVRVDHEVFALLARCEAARQFTNGWFDVTATSPHRAALELDEATGTVQFAHPAAAIDLGGVAKGYALDCGREILQRFGVTCALLNGGTSSVLAIGSARGAEGWPVAIQPANCAAAVVKLKNQSFSCSAVRRADETASDILNPQTGAPLGGDATCYVIADSAAEAEIYSTALLVMGRERAASFIRELSPEIEAGWIEGEGHFMLRSS